MPDLLLRRALVLTHSVRGLVRDRYSFSGLDGSAAAVVVHLVDPGERAQAASDWGTGTRLTQLLARPAPAPRSTAGEWGVLRVDPSRSGEDRRTAVLAGQPYAVAEDFALRLNLAEPPESRVLYLTTEGLSALPVPRCCP